MELRGKVTHKLQPFINEQGETKSQEFVIEHESGQYPKIACIKCFSKILPQLDTVHVGDDVTVKINVDAREYNGKYYNQLTAYEVKREF